MLRRQTSLLWVVALLVLGLGWLFLPAAANSGDKGVALYWSPGYYSAAGTTTNRITFMMAPLWDASTLAQIGLSTPDGFQLVFRSLPSNGAAYQAFTQANACTLYGLYSSATTTAFLTPSNDGSTSFGGFLPVAFVQLVGAGVRVVCGTYKPTTEQASSTPIVVELFSGGNSDPFWTTTLTIPAITAVPDAIAITAGWDGSLGPYPIGTLYPNPVTLAFTAGGTATSCLGLSGATPRLLGDQTSGCLAVDETTSYLRSSAMAPPQFATSDLSCAPDTGLVTLAANTILLRRPGARFLVLDVSVDLFGNGTLTTITTSLTGLTPVTLTSTNSADTPALPRLTAPAYNSLPNIAAPWTRSPIYTSISFAGNKDPGQQDSPFPLYQDPLVPTGTGLDVKVPHGRARMFAPFMDAAAGFPLPRSRPATCVAGNVMYMYGGADGTNAVLADLWKFDLVSNRWTQLHAPLYAPLASDMPIGRIGASLACISGSTTLYLYGGYRLSRVNGAIMYFSQLGKLEPVNSTAWAWTCILSCNNNFPDGAGQIGGSYYPGTLGTTRPYAPSIELPWGAEAWMFVHSGSYLWLMGGRALNGGNTALAHNMLFRISTTDFSVTYLGGSFSNTGTAGTWPPPAFGPSCTTGPGTIVCFGGARDNAGLSTTSLYGRVWFLNPATSTFSVWTGEPVTDSFGLNAVRTLTRNAPDVMSGQESNAFAAMHPGGRFAHSLAVNANKQLALFGGFTHPFTATLPTGFATRTKFAEPVRLANNATVIAWADPNFLHFSGNGVSRLQCQYTVDMLESYMLGSTFYMRNLRISIPTNWAPPSSSSLRWRAAAWFGPAQPVPMTRYATPSDPANDITAQTYQNTIPLNSAWSAATGSVILPVTLLPKTNGARDATFFSSTSPTGVATSLYVDFEMNNTGSPITSSSPNGASLRALAGGVTGLCFGTTAGASSGSARSYIPQVTIFQYVSDNFDEDATNDMWFLDLNALDGWKYGNIDYSPMSAGFVPANYVLGSRLATLGSTGVPAAWPATRLYTTLAHVNNQLWLIGGTTPGTVRYPSGSVFWGFNSVWTFELGNPANPTAATCMDTQVASSCACATTASAMSPWNTAFYAHFADSTVGGRACENSCLALAGTCGESTGAGTCVDGALDVHCKCADFMGGNACDTPVAASASARLTGPATLNAAPAVAVAGTAQPTYDSSPGSRVMAQYATDQTNKIIYMYGGYSTSGGTMTYYRDLWSYTLAAGRWSRLWVAPTSPTLTVAVSTPVVAVTTLASYSSVSAAPYAPGPSYGGAFWLRASGGCLYLWIAGLYAPPDVWTYCSGTWTRVWTYSSTFSTWFNAGTAAGTSTLPNPRQGFAWHWSDATNTLVVFGGGFIQDRQSGASAPNWKAINSDLYSFSVATNKWTQLATCAPDYYNGVDPAGRIGASLVQTATAIYIIGGYTSGYAPPAYDAGPAYVIQRLLISDIWVFTRSSSTWTVFARSAKLNPVYGFGEMGSVNVRVTRGVPLERQWPSARAFAGSALSSDGRSLILYGGLGYDTNGTLTTLNDAWTTVLASASAPSWAPLNADAPANTGAPPTASNTFGVNAVSVGRVGAGFVTVTDEFFVFHGLTLANSLPTPMFVGTAASNTNLLFNLYSETALDDVWMVNRKCRTDCDATYGTCDLSLLSPLFTTGDRACQCVSRLHTGDTCAYDVCGDVCPTAGSCTAATSDSGDTTDSTVTCSACAGADQFGPTCRRVASDAGLPPSDRTLAQAIAHAQPASQAQPGFSNRVWAASAVGMAPLSLNYPSAGLTVRAPYSVVLGGLQPSSTPSSTSSLSSLLALVEHGSTRVVTLLADDWDRVSANEAATSLADGFHLGGSFGASAVVVTDSGSGVSSLFVFGGHYLGASGYARMDKLLRFTLADAVAVRATALPLTLTLNPGSTTTPTAWADGPGHRLFAHTVAAPDGSGFYLYGGLVLATAGVGYAADLWRYTVATDQWVALGCVYPTLNYVASAALYAAGTTTGTLASGFCPPARTHAGFTLYNGRLWIAGGLGAAGPLNDLWAFDLGASQFYRVAGTYAAPGNQHFTAIGTSTTVPHHHFGAAWASGASGKTLTRYGGWVAQRTRYGVYGPTTHTPRPTPRAPLGAASLWSDTSTLFPLHSAYPAYHMQILLRSEQLKASGVVATRTPWRNLYLRLRQAIDGPGTLSLQFKYLFTTSALPADGINSFVDVSAATSCGAAQTFQNTNKDMRTRSSRDDTIVVVPCDAAGANTGISFATWTEGTHLLLDITYSSTPSISPGALAISAFSDGVVRTKSRGYFATAPTGTNAAFPLPLETYFTSSSAPEVGFLSASAEFSVGTQVPTMVPSNALAAVDLDAAWTALNAGAPLVEPFTTWTGTKFSVDAGLTLGADTDSPAVAFAADAATGWTRDTTRAPPLAGGMLLHNVASADVSGAGATGGGNGWVAMFGTNTLLTFTTTWATSFLIPFATSLYDTTLATSNPTVPIPQLVMPASTSTSASSAASLWSVRLAPTIAQPVTAWLALPANANTAPQSAALSVQSATRVLPAGLSTLAASYDCAALLDASTLATLTSGGDGSALACAYAPNSATLVITGLGPDVVAAATATDFPIAPSVTLLSSLHAALAPGPAAPAAPVTVAVQLQSQQSLATGSVFIHDNGLSTDTACGAVSITLQPFRVLAGVTVTYTYVFSDSGQPDTLLDDEIAALNAAVASEHSTTLTFDAALMPPATSVTLAVTASFPDDTGLAPATSTKLLTRPAMATPLQTLACSASLVDDRTTFATVSCTAPQFTSSCLAADLAQHGLSCALASTGVTLAYPAVPLPTDVAGLSASLVAGMVPAGTAWSLNCSVVVSFPTYPATPPVQFTSAALISLPASAVRPAVQITATRFANTLDRLDVIFSEDTNQAKDGDCSALFDADTLLRFGSPADTDCTWSSPSVLSVALGSGYDLRPTASLALLDSAGLADAAGTGAYHGLRKDVTTVTAALAPVAPALTLSLTDGVGCVDVTVWAGGLSGTGLHALQYNWTLAADPHDDFVATVVTPIQEYSATRPWTATESPWSVDSLVFSPATGDQYLRDGNTVQLIAINWAGQASTHTLVVAAGSHTGIIKMQPQVTVNLGVLEGAVTLPAPATQFSSSGDTDLVFDYSCVLSTQTSGSAADPATGLLSAALPFTLSDYTGIASGESLAFTTTCTGVASLLPTCWDVSTGTFTLTTVPVAVPEARLSVDMRALVFTFNLAMTPLGADDPDSLCSTVLPTLLTQLGAEPTCTWTSSTVFTVALGTDYTLRPGETVFQWAAPVATANNARATVPLEDVTILDAVEPYETLSISVAGTLTRCLASTTVLTVTPTAGTADSALSHVWSLTSSTNATRQALFASLTAAQQISLAPVGRAGEYSLSIIVMSGEDIATLFPQAEETAGGTLELSVTATNLLGASTTRTVTIASSTIGWTVTASAPATVGIWKVRALAPWTVGYTSTTADTSVVTPSAVTYTWSKVSGLYTPPADPQDSDTLDVLRTDIADTPAVLAVVVTATSNGCSVASPAAQVTFAPETIPQPQITLLLLFPLTFTLQITFDSLTNQPGGAGPASAAVCEAIFDSASVSMLGTAAACAWTSVSDPTTQGFVTSEAVAPPAPTSADGDMTSPVTSLVTSAVATGAPTPPTADQLVVTLGAGYLVRNETTLTVLGGVLSDDSGWSGFAANEATPPILLNAAALDGAEMTIELYGTVSACYGTFFAATVSGDTFSNAVEYAWSVDDNPALTAYIAQLVAALPATTDFTPTSSPLYLPMVNISYADRTTLVPSPPYTVHLLVTNWAGVTATSSFSLTLADEFTFATTAESHQINPWDEAATTFTVTGPVTATLVSPYAVVPSHATTMTWEWTSSDPAFADMYPSAATTTSTNELTLPSLFAYDASLAFSVTVTDSVSGCQVQSQEFSFLVVQDAITLPAGATWSTDLTTLTIPWSVTTSSPGGTDADTAAVCAAVFDESTTTLLGPSTTCAWTKRSLLTITLGWGHQVRPNSLLAFLADTVQSSTLKSTLAGGSIPIALAGPAAAVWATGLPATAVLDTCLPNTLDVDVTDGGAGSAVRYEWSLVGVDPTDPRATALATYVDSLQTFDPARAFTATSSPRLVPTLTLSPALVAALFPADAPAGTLAVTLTNWAGNTHTVFIDLTRTPSLAVGFTSGLPASTEVSDTLSVTLSVATAITDVAAQPFVGSFTFSFAWTADETVTNLPYSSESVATNAGASTWSVPPIAVTPGATAELTVAVTAHLTGFPLCSMSQTTTGQLLTTGYRPAPVLVSSVLAANLTSLVLTFDTATAAYYATGGTQLSRANCNAWIDPASLLSLGNAAQLACLWSDPTIFSIQLGNDFTMRLGDSIRLLGGLTCAGGSLPLAASTVVTAVAPADADSLLVPAIATVPTSPSPCVALTLDASLSSVGLGLLKGSYEWSLLPTAGNTNAAQVAAFATLIAQLLPSPNPTVYSSSSAPNYLPVVTVPSTLVTTVFPVNSTQTVQLTVTNWVGQRRSVQLAIAMPDSDIPSVLIKGTNPLTQAYSLPYTASADVAPSRCRPASEVSLSLLWRHTSGPDIPDTTETATPTPTPYTSSASLLYLGVRALPMGIHVFTATVTQTVLATGVQRSVTASAEVHVTPSALVAAITGGNRLFAASVDMILSSVGSKDPDSATSTATSADLLFAWACSFASDGTPCFDAPLTADLATVNTTRKRTVPAVALQTIIDAATHAADTLLFTLTVSSPVAGDARTATATMWATLSGAATVYSVSMPRGASSVLYPQVEDLSLAGVVTVVSALPTPPSHSLLWTCDTRNVNMSDATLRSTNVTDATLTFLVGALAPGLYRFRLSIFNESVTPPSLETIGSTPATSAGPLVGEQSSTVVEVRVLAPPKNGACSITPPAGTIMDTYVLLCGAWQTDLPQATDPTYRWILLSGPPGSSSKVTETEIGIPLKSNSLTAELGPGKVVNNYLQYLAVDIADVYGTTRREHLTVHVGLPPSATPDDLIDSVRDEVGARLTAALATADPNLLSQALVRASSVADWAIENSFVNSTSLEGAMVVKPEVLEQARSLRTSLVLTLADPAALNAMGAGVLAQQAADANSASFAPASDDSSDGDGDGDGPSAEEVAAAAAIAAANAALLDPSAPLPNKATLRLLTTVCASPVQLNATLAGPTAMRLQSSVLAGLLITGASTMPISDELLEMTLGTLTGVSASFQIAQNEADGLNTTVFVTDDGSMTDGEDSDSDEDGAFRVLGVRRDGRSSRLHSPRRRSVSASASALSTGNLNPHMELVAAANVATQHLQTQLHLLAVGQAVGAAPGAAARVTSLGGVRLQTQRVAVEDDQSTQLPGLTFTPAGASDPITVTFPRAALTNLRTGDASSTSAFSSAMGGFGRHIALGDGSLSVVAPAPVQSASQLGVTGLNVAMVVVEDPAVLAVAGSSAASTSTASRNVSSSAVVVTLFNQSSFGPAVLKAVVDGASGETIITPATLTLDMSAVIAAAVAAANSTDGSSGSGTGDGSGSGGESSGNGDGDGGGDGDGDGGENGEVDDPASDIYVSLTIPHAQVPTNALGNYTRSCRFWQDTGKQWDATGCSVDDDLSTNTTTVCRCAHLTMFKINFSPRTLAPKLNTLALSDFANLTWPNIVAHPVPIIMLLCWLGALILCGFWVYKYDMHKDKRGLRKLVMDWNDDFIPPELYGDNDHTGLAGAPSLLQQALFRGSRRRLLQQHQARGFSQLSLGQGARDSARDSNAARGSVLLTQKEKGKGAERGGERDSAERGGLDLGGADAVTLPVSEADAHSDPTLTRTENYTQTETHTQTQTHTQTGTEDADVLGGEGAHKTRRMTKLRAVYLHFLDQFRSRHTPVSVFFRRNTDSFSSTARLGAVFVAVLSGFMFNALFFGRNSGSDGAEGLSRVVVSIISAALLFPVNFIVSYVAVRAHPARLKGILYEYAEEVAWALRHDGASRVYGKDFLRHWPRQDAPISESDLDDVARLAGWNDTRRQSWRHAWRCISASKRREEQRLLHYKLRSVFEIDPNHLLSCYYRRPFSASIPRGWPLLASVVVLLWVLLCGVLVLTYGIKFDREDAEATAKWLSGSAISNALQWGVTLPIAILIRVLILFFYLICIRKFEDHALGPMRNLDRRLTARHVLAGVDDVEAFNRYVGHVAELWYATRDEVQLEKIGMRRVRVTAAGDDGGTGGGAGEGEGEGGRVDADGFEVSMEDEEDAQRFVDGEGEGLEGRVSGRDSYRYYAAALVSAPRERSHAASRPVRLHGLAAVAAQDAEETQATLAGSDLAADAIAADATADEEAGAGAGVRSASQTSASLSPSAAGAGAVAVATPRAAPRMPLHSKLVIPKTPRPPDSSASTYFWGAASSSSSSSPAASASASAAPPPRSPWQRGSVIESPASLRTTLNDFDAVAMAVSTSSTPVPTSLASFSSPAPQPAAPACVMPVRAQTPVTPAETAGLLVEADPARTETTTETEPELVALVPTKLPAPPQSRLAVTIHACGDQDGDSGAAIAPSPLATSTTSPSAARAQGYN